MSSGINSHGKVPLPPIPWSRLQAATIRFSLSIFVSPFCHFAVHLSQDDLCKLSIHTRECVLPPDWPFNNRCPSTHSGEAYIFSMLSFVELDGGENKKVVQARTLPRYNSRISSRVCPKMNTRAQKAMWCIASWNLMGMSSGPGTYACTLRGMWCGWVKVTKSHMRCIPSRNAMAVKIKGGEAHAARTASWNVMGMSKTWCKRICSA